MPNRLRITLPAVLLASLLATGSTCRAQEVEKRFAAPDEPADNWYYRPQTYQPNPRAIIQERAFTRANQRQARLAALSWYGMYNARPTAAPTPFTSLYSPVWQQPGGRPFAWYAASRPTYVFYR
jgi:hypothetical protein